MNRKDYPAGQDCSGTPSQEIVGFLSDTTNIGHINAGECIDYGNTMSFKCLGIRISSSWLLGVVCTTVCPGFNTLITLNLDSETRRFAVDPHVHSGSHLFHPLRFPAALH